MFQITHNLVTVIISWMVCHLQSTSIYGSYWTQSLSVVECTIEALQLQKPCVKIQSLQKYIPFCFYSNARFSRVFFFLFTNDTTISFSHKKQVWNVVITQRFSLCAIHRVILTKTVITENYDAFMDYKFVKNVYNNILSYMKCTKLFILVPWIV